MPSVRGGLDDEDPQDALGEIANMMCRNLKSVLPHGVRIGIPAIEPASESFVCESG